MTRVDFSEHPSLEPVFADDMDIRCPMCRSTTRGSFDRELEAALKERYPEPYRSRAEDEAQKPTTLDSGAVETVTVYVGNEHRLHRPEDPESKNVHNWTFFVRPSRTDIIEEVQVFLYVSAAPRGSSFIAQVARRNAGGT